MNRFDKIIEQINEQEIKPTSRWYFMTKNVWIWCIFIVMTVLGSMAFSIVLFSIQQSDFQLLSHFSHSKTEMILSLIPYFWLISLLLFTLLGLFSFLQFKRAYKIPIWHIVEFNILFSAIIGTLLYITNGAQFLEQKFAVNVPFYKSVEQQKLKQWMQPDKGFLAGTIITSKQDTLILTDFNGKEWQIIYHDIFIPPILNLEKDEKIKIAGKILTNNYFEATEIRPWRAFEMNNPKKMKEFERKLKDKRNQ